MDFTHNGRKTHHGPSLAAGARPRPSVARESARLNLGLAYFKNAGGEPMSPHQGKFIAYFRVSTDKQGKSGLGLEAQRKAVLDYLDGGRWSLVQEFVEVESGKHNERPQLTAALAACKKFKAKLVIAKLDRLSRNLALSPR